MLEHGKDGRGKGTILRWPQRGGGKHRRPERNVRSKNSCSIAASAICWRWIGTSRPDAFAVLTLVARYAGAH